MFFLSAQRFLKLTSLNRQQYRNAAVNVLQITHRHFEQVLSSPFGRVVTLILFVATAFSIAAVSPPNFDRHVTFLAHNEADTLRAELRDENRAGQACNFFKFTLVSNRPRRKAVFGDAASA
jgi:hypothetical protein